MSIWAHVRLAGAVLVFVGYFANSLPLVVAGLLTQWGGMVFAVASLERKFAELTREENNDKSSSGE